MRKEAIAILVLALVARAALVAILPVQDPDEGRYAQIAQGMVQSGDWVTPRFWDDGQHKSFLGKPPLYFWMAAGCMKALGPTIFAARIPGLLAAVATVVLLLAVLGRCVSRGSAELAAVLTASAGLFFALAGAAVVDMVLTFFVSGAVLAYVAFSCETSPGRRTRWSLLIFALLAGGFLTKGPVAVALFGLPTLIWTAWHRAWPDLRDHAWFRGGLLFLALTVPWFWLCEQRNPGFLKYFFVNENLLRFLTHDYGDRYGEGHTYPRGSAVVMIVLATLPWSLWAGRLLWQQWRRRHDARLPASADRVSRFLLLGFAANVAFWCLARQLLLTYMLPLVPLFCAWLAVRVYRDGAPSGRPFAIAAAAVALYALVGALAVPIALEKHGKSLAGVLKRANALTEEHGITGPWVFVRRTPYSAYVQAGERLLTHPDESPAESVSRGLALAEPCLFLFRRRYVERLPAELRERLRVLDDGPTWVLGVPAARGTPQAQADQADQATQTASGTTQEASDGPNP